VDVEIATNASIINWRVSASSLSAGYSYFSNSIPFMNMLIVQKPYRGRGIGTQLTILWEQAMPVRSAVHVRPTQRCRYTGPILQP